MQPFDPDERRSLAGVTGALSPIVRMPHRYWSISRAIKRNGLNAGYAIEAVLFLDAAGRLWHPLLRDHIPLPRAVQFCSLS
jgi:hypothetical protein